MSWSRIVAWSVLLQSPLRGQSAGRPREGGRCPLDPCCPGFSPAARERGEEEAVQLPSVLLAPLPGNCPPMSAPCSGGGPFLHSPSGRMRNGGPAKATPHDGFNDYDFLMWGTALGRVWNEITYSCLLVYLAVAFLENSFIFTLNDGLFICERT